MKVSQIGVIAVMLVVIAVAFAGCTGSTPAAAPAASGTPSSGGEATGGAQAPSGGSSAGSSDWSDVFGGMNFNWYEYKTVVSSEGTTVIMYTKYDRKNGICSSRMEMNGMVMNEQTFDCSASAETPGQSDPVDIVAPDTKMVKVGTETVTVGAGTFVADKYTISTDSGTVYIWITEGKPPLKTESQSSEGSYIQELNGWG